MAAWLLLMLVGIAFPGGQQLCLHAQAEQTADLTITRSPIPAPDDWPTFRHDPQRSGSTNSSLKLPLALHWQTRPAAPPQPAWTTASANIYAGINHLHPSETADRAPHAVIADGRCWYASSATDTVYCRKLSTGDLLWAYSAAAPVRLPPSVAGGCVYVAADDGLVTCLGVERGEIVWQRRIGPEERWMPGNSRLISRWPIRSGPLVQDGRVYVGAGVFPGDGVILACLDAKSGAVVRQRPIDMVISGPMLANAERLFVQALRSQPQAFALDSGKPLGPLPGGGSLAAVWKSQLVTGPNEVGNVTGLDNAVLGALPDRHQFQFTTRGAALYAASEQLLVAVDSERKVRWKTPRRGSRSLIVAHDLLVAGGDGGVSVYRTSDGEQVGQAKIEGSALGLAVAGGCLLVSSDQGQVYCFGSETSAPNSPKHQSDQDEQPSGDHHLAAERARLAKKLSQFAPAAGYALVIDPPHYDIVAPLTADNALQWIAVYSDSRVTAGVRTQFRRAGLVGTRATAIAQPEHWSALPAQALNCIVAFADPRHAPLPINHWKSLLQPYNGTLLIVTPKQAPAIADLKKPGETLTTFSDWTINVLRASSPAGLGEWSHPYADPGNSACSQDAHVKGPFELQWFGPPGPQHMVDRHNRTSPPLFVAGRLIVPGLDRVTAVDAYNGANLWERMLPGSTRLAVSKNTGHVVADKNHVYVAREAECVVIDAASGQIVRTLKISEPAEAGKEWGYLALSNDVLLGSVSTSEEKRRHLTRQSWELGYLDGQPLVVSERLFGRSPATGSKLWEYRPRGAIVNTAIAAGNGHVYFVESTDPATLEKNTGRLPLARLLERGANLVAVRLDTGRETWRQSVKLPMRHSLYLSLIGTRLALSGSRNDGTKLVCDIAAHDADNGKQQWALTQPTGLGVGGSHGEQEQHPLVVGDTLFFKTFACDLATGAVKKNWKIPVLGCGALSASMHSAFYRAGTASYCDFQDGQNTSLTGVTRPGCWLNMLPAGGLLLAPESSSGCTCVQYSVQTSLALRPLAAPPPDVLAGFGANKIEPLAGDIEYAGRLQVVLKGADSSSEIRYTLDGSWPSPQSPTYQEPLTIDRAATLLARTYRDGQPGGITRRQLRCVEVPRLTSLTTTIVTSAKIEFARYPGDAVIRYELDGKSPTPSSPVYDKPVVVTEPSQLRAAYFADGRKLGNDLSAEFRKVAGRKPDQPTAVKPGLKFDYFEVDQLTKLPNMDRLTPTRSGVVDRLAIPPHRPNHFAVRYRGYLEVPADGVYSFRLLSDDGSELRIGDEVLISHDGIHDARSEQQATIALAAGKHRIEVRYFDGDDKEVLLVRYGTPGADKNELPAAALWHDP